MSKYNFGLKKLLLQGLSEPEFYGDLVYKFRKIICRNDFPDWHPFRVVLGRAYRGLSGVFLLLRNVSVAISVSPCVCFILVLILISMFLR